MRSEVSVLISVVLKLRFMLYPVTGVSPCVFQKISLFQRIYFHLKWGDDRRNKPGSFKHRNN